MADSIEINLDSTEFLFYLKWSSVNALFSAMGLISLDLFIAPFWKYDKMVLLVIVLAIIPLNVGLVNLAHLLRRHKPYHCLGNVGKLIIEVITVSAAVATRHFLGYSIYLLLILLMFTVHLHVILQFMHFAYDISLGDVNLGSLIQFAGFMTAGNAYVLSVSLLLCAWIIFYRYITYSPPEIPTLEIPICS